MLHGETRRKRCQYERAFVNVTVVTIDRARYVVTARREFDNVFQSITATPVLSFRFVHAPQERHARLEGAFLPNERSFIETCNWVGEWHLRESSANIAVFNINTIRKLCLTNEKSY